MGRPSPEAFAVYPSAIRSWIFAVAAFLFAIPGVMILATENGPGVVDDVLSYGLIVFGIGGGMYLLRRRRRPIFSADASGLVYVPYDDPVARLRYGKEVRIPWFEIEAISEEFVGAPAVPVLVVRTREGDRIELPLLMLGMSAADVRHRLQDAAGAVTLPFDGSG